MTSKPEPVPIVCAGCAAPFTLTPQAHARRMARYGGRLLCSRCLSDSWLRTRGSYQKDALLREHEDDSRASGGAR